MTLLELLINEHHLEEKKAKALIMSGVVLVNNEPIIISSHKIKECDLVRIKYNKKWVSRGAYKLLEAINKFKINISDCTCLDIGSSTGGFTQVLLDFGARKVFALDSGTNQLDYSLRTNPKVFSLEKTNLKSINSNLFNNEKIDIVTCDVSFISVKNVFNVLNSNILSSKNNIVILIKPQFEAESKIVEDGGYVDEKHHQKIIDNIINYAKDKEFKLIEIIKSPILGNKSKNIEYLAWFKFEKI